MQIERVAARMAVATGKAVAVDNQTSQASAASGKDTSDTSSGTSKDTATGEPVKGGTRTVSANFFNLEVELEADVSFDFADIVAEKTRLLSTTLSDLFKGMGVRADETISLSVDSIGMVSCSGTSQQKQEKLEAFFNDNPELVKQIKEVIALQSMLAMKMALDKWMEAKKKAKTDEERDAVDRALLGDLGTIKALKNTLVFQDGNVTSAALAYMNGAR